jgi:cytochrome oxidase assembly protein ShyY1
MKTLKNILGIAICCVLVIILSLGCWYVKRAVNWKFGYKGMAEDHLKGVKTRLDGIEKRLEKLERAR